MGGWGSANHYNAHRSNTLQGTNACPCGTAVLHHAARLRLTSWRTHTGFSGRSCKATHPTPAPTSKHFESAQKSRNVFRCDVNVSSDDEHTAILVLLAPTKPTLNPCFIEVVRNIKERGSEKNMFCMQIHKSPGSPCYVLQPVDNQQSVQSNESTALKSTLKPAAF